MGVKTVRVSGICWTDAEGGPVTEMSGRSLPESIGLKMGIPAGDWSATRFALSRSSAMRPALTRSGNVRAKLQVES